MEELGTTLNEEYLFWYKSRVKSLYESSAKAAFSEFGETRILQAMARDFAKYECALDFMAEVRAYFQGSNLFSHFSSFRLTDDILLQWLTNGSLIKSAS
jgi:hypothetical protein